jgi:hypothetical protein
MCYSHFSGKSPSGGAHESSKILPSNHLLDGKKRINPTDRHRIRVTHLQESCLFIDSGYDSIDH